VAADVTRAAGRQQHPSLLVVSGAGAMPVRRG